MNNLLRNIILASLLGMLYTSIPAQSQDVYIASWTIQDPAHDLRQELAEQIIERANIWLTRDNPEAATVRLDDKIRVTVVGEYNQRDGQTREKLVRVNIGGLILEEDVRNFLDTGLTQKILLRDYYWRDENLNVLDPALTPSHRSLEKEADLPSGKPTYENSFSTTLPDHPVLSLNRSILPLRAVLPDAEGLALTAGLGYEELGLPGLTYRRLRLGVAANGISAWYEHPLNLSVDPVITGANEAAGGAGLAFDLDYFGGSIVWSDAYSISEIENDTGFMQSRSALLYGTIPAGYVSALNSWVRVKVGGAYLQGTELLSEDSGEVRTGRTFDMTRLFLRGELATTDGNGQLHQKATLGVFGTGITASYYKRFSANIGVEANLAVHGVFGTRAPFLPSTAIWISPVWYLN